MRAMRRSSLSVRKGECPLGVGRPRRKESSFVTIVQYSSSQPVPPQVRHLADLPLCDGVVLLRRHSSLGEKASLLLRHLRLNCPPRQRVRRVTVALLPLVFRLGHPLRGGQRQNLQLIVPHVRNHRQDLFLDQSRFRRILLLEPVVWDFVERPPQPANSRIQ